MGPPEENQETAVVHGTDDTDSHITNQHICYYVALHISGYTADRQSCSADP